MSLHQKIVKEFQDKEEKKIKDEQERQQNRQAKKQELSNLSNDLQEILPINDERLYVLPNKIIFDFRYQQNLLARIEKVPEEVRNSVLQIENFLLKNLQMWDFQNNSQFNFKFPQTIFENFKNKTIQYFQPNTLQEEYTSVKRLNKQQFDSIQKTGTFKVESKTYQIPYVWQLNPWIVKGQQEIKKSLDYNLSFAFHQIINIKYRIKNRMENEYYRNGIDIVSGCKNFYYFARNMVNLLIGLRKMSVIYKQNIEKQQIIMRQLELRKKYQNNININLELFKNFETEQHDNNLSNLLARENYDRLKKYHTVINDDFYQAWSKEKVQLDKQLQEAQGDYSTLLRQAQYNFLFKFIQQVEKFSPLEKQHYIQLIQALEIIQQEDQKMKECIQKKKDEITEDIKKKHTIKHKVYWWLEDQVFERMAPIKTKLFEEFCDSVIEAMIKQNLNDSIILFKDYADYRKNYEQILAKNMPNIIKALEVPKREFTTVQMLFPPYEKKQILANNYYNINYQNNQQDKLIWTLVKTKSYTTKSDHAFWRIELLLLRYKVWSINTAFWLFANAIQGPLGIKALLCKEKFQPDVNIKHDTGEVYQDGFIVTPVIRTFQNVLEGIERSRQHFERAPDTGFFGKNFSRLFNYIECYLFRFLIVGIMIILILMPITIVVNVLISLTLAITSWIWSPITLLIRFIINFLIFDFDTDYRFGSYSYGYNLNQSAKIFPLFQEAYKLLVKGLGQIALSAVSMIIIHPFMALLAVIFSYLRFILRQIHDFVMFMIIKLLGREPILENKIAWKISGMGVGRQFYMTLSEEDVLILIFANLEQIEMQIYQKKMHDLIHQPQIIAQNILQNIFNYFLIDNFQVSIDIISKNCTLVQNAFQRAFQNRWKVYPCMSNAYNIRFTEQELNELFPKTRELIYNFITIRQMEQAIYSYFQLEPKEQDMYKVTQLIWKNTFSENALTPIEDIEHRFKVKRIDDNLSINKITLAMEGQVNLSKFTYKVQPKQQQKIERYLGQFIDIAYILSKINNFNACQVDTPYSSQFIDFKQHEPQKKIQADIDKKNK